jgi:regulator of sirC expression with transglutaminase-like and TPR domain
MNLTHTLHLLSKNSTADVDLAAVALHLARDAFPYLDVEGYLGELDAMAQEAGRFLRGSLVGQVTGLCRYLFHDMGFRGNATRYYDPMNSYLNVVLDRRLGIPISLSLVVLAVGRRAGLEIQGVGLPGHFIVKAVQDSQEVLFDPFHGGRRLQPVDCENLVRQVTGLNFKANAENLSALPPSSILQRMLNNLKAIYLGEKDYTGGIRTIQRLQQLNPNDPIHDRDLGACYLHDGQPGKAIDHLQTYLFQLENAQDAEAVEALLRRAQSEVARWN